MAYRLSFSDELPVTVRACAREQLKGAAQRLADDGGDPVEAVHDARKRLKKTRSLLRLVRPALGGAAYGAENEALREIALMLSSTRDADVLVATVEKLADRDAGGPGPSDFAQLRETLAAEARAAREGAAAVDVAAVAEQLHAAAARVRRWPLSDAGWDAALGGAGRAYGRGVDAFALAREDPSVARLHEWRKRVKDLWYHHRLLVDAWPEAFGAYAREAKVLSELLGDDHDLAVLCARIDAGVALPTGAAVDLDALRELIGERRAELQEQANRLGRRLYAERPAAFARRLRRLVRAAIDDARPGAPV